jgi:hypothetical protein
MGLFNLFKPSKTVLIVDGVSLNDALGLKGKVPPRNQLQLLRRLARFAQREKMEMVVVLSGSPLNKAPAGKKFEDITVIYSKSPEAHAKFLARTAGSRGAGAILISGNAAAEKIAGGRVQTMRMSTFRKAFDFGGSEFEGSERSERGERGGNNRNRPPRRRQQKAGGDKKGGGDKKAGGDKKQDRAPKQVSESDAINELIDLVD